ncbi:hypothetical protein ACJ41O_015002 [Fusarium nematophilum]
MRLCDGLVDASIQVQCVDALWYVAATPEHAFPSPVFILALLMTMPPVLSGTFSSLVNDWFWLETMYAPVEAYLRDDVSDRGSVRYFLVGTLLRGFFCLTSATMAIYDSVLWILAVGLGALMAALIGLVMTFVDGPWIWIRYKEGGKTGSLLERQASKFLRHTIVYAATLFMISLNQLAKWAARHSQPGPEPPVVEQGRPEALYQYRPLGSTQIRLLRVLPGQASEAIRCRLETVDLRSKPSFEAISYVWGSGPPDRFVIVDGARLDLMTSAFSVIQRRRSRHRERILWIDQLCINQTDKAERESQVRLMGNIYKSARRVIAWLGHSDSAHQVQCFLAELHYKKEGLGLSGYSLKRSTVYAEGPQWYALFEFLKNEWFTRMWIVQEAASSTKLHLLYGDICLDWDAVTEGLPVLWEKEVLGNVPPLDGSYFSDSRKQYHHRLNNAKTMLEFRGDVDHGRIFTLSMALSSCCAFQCKDPRDKIYALANILEKRAIKPDYNIPASKLYTLIMRDVLLEDDSPDSLAFAGTGCRPSVVDNLPSWVSDWDADSRRPRHYDTYSAGLSHRYVIAFDGSESTIVTLEGWERDSIEHLTGALEISAATNTVESNRIQSSWYATAQSMATQHAAANGEEDHLESFVRTMLGDRISDLGDRPSTAECLKRYQGLQEYFSLFEPAYVLKINRVTSMAISMACAFSKAELEIMRRFDQASLITEDFKYFSPVFGRRFCVTTRGRMAIVPRHARKGDIICVVKGARMPFILRGRGEEHSDAYELVGACYVHGLMDGGDADGPERRFNLY